MLPKVLQGLKIASNDRNVRLTIDDGTGLKSAELESTKDLRAVFGNPDLVQANETGKNDNPIPLYMKRPNDPYWFEYIQDKNIAYIQLNSIQNKPDVSIDKFFTHVFGAAENGSVEKLVLDLRQNTGGNNLLNKPIITGLIKSKLNRRGRLFVIIGRKTVSAAQNLVNEIEKYTDAILVGEPTGSNPNHFGDPVEFVLPNSKLTFRASSLWHQINPRDRRKWTFPEIAAGLTFQDYQNNTDPSWEAILRYRPGLSFKDLTREAASNRSIADFVRKYDDFKANPRNKYLDTEAETNTLGYTLLQENRYDDAIKVFKLNVRDYPKSANVYDSLGEAYLKGGNQIEAARNYKLALKINPNLQSAIDALRRLGH
jgi:hypothetical protein